MSESEYTIEQVDQWMAEAIENGTHIKLMYGPGESGWAIDIGGGRALITNSPLVERLNVKDVVEITVSGEGRPMAGRVVWRAYPCKTGIEYPAPDRDTAHRNYGAMYDACQRHKLVIEGFVSGMCMVSHPENVDVEAVFRQEGIDTSKMRFEDCIE